MCIRDRLWVEARGQSTSGMPQAVIDIFGSSLPDMRGEYVRVFDNGRGVDSGRSILSSQNQQLIQHNHSATFTGSAVSGHTHSRGTMEIEGVISASRLHNADPAHTGAFSDGGGVNRTRPGSSGSSSQPQDIQFTASDNWTGSTSSAGGHTPSGSCLLYTSPSPRDRTRSRMPSSA